MELIQSTMKKYLEPLEEIDIEIYSFDPSAYDPLFDQLKKIANSEDYESYQKLSGIKDKAYRKIIDSVRDQTIKGMSELSRIDGIGKTTIDNLYIFLSKLLHQSILLNNQTKASQNIQPPLFEL